MLASLVSKGTVQFICSIEESILLRQALISFQYDNEQYMRMFQNDPTMERTFINSKENAEEAEKLLSQMHW